MSVTEDSLLLALNAGSSSLKAKLYALGATGGRLEQRSSAQLDGIGRREAQLRVDGAGFSAAGSVGDHLAAAELLLSQLLPSARGVGHRLAAIGHRVVHGGERFTVPTRITPETWRDFEALRELAPLHNPPALSVVRATAARYRGVPLFAVFDTGFFAGLPAEAREYALPVAWRVDRGLRRFGFHGLAHEYLARSALERCAQPRRLVTLQLGHGCSVTALLDGRPLDTSMGFSPLEGLIMATRPGDLDAGVLLELARRGESWQTLTDSLYRECGLVGLSGASGDIRELLELEAEGHAGAELALKAFCRRVVKYLGAYAAVLGGLDAIAIGGGVGENSPVVRARIFAAFDWLGLTLDAAANDEAIGVAARISTPASGVVVEVVPVDEELLIAEQVRDSLLAPVSNEDRQGSVS
jgi:acetate kinase